MNEDQRNELERLLRSLPLERPSSDLDERVASLLRSTPLRRRRRWKLAAAVAASLAAAASLLLAARLWVRPEGRPAEPVARPSLASKAPTPAVPVDGASPGHIRIERVWSTVSGKEAVISEGAAPMQRVKHQIVRQVQWIDGRQNARIEWTIPSQETVLLPLEYN